MTYPHQTKTVLAGKETTWGTPVTANKDMGIIKSITDTMSRVVNQTNGVGNIEDQKITSGMGEAMINMTIEFQHGRIFEYTIGAVGHATTGSDEKHTFTIADATPAATIESSENLTTDTVRTYEGMLIESCEIRSALNETITIRATWKGQSVLSSTTASASTTSTLAVFPHALTAITIDGNSPTQVQEAVIRIVKKVVLVGGLGHNVPQAGAGTEIHFEYSLKLGFDAVTYQQVMYGGTGGATSPDDTSDPGGYTLVFNSHNGVALGSGRREIKITLDNCIDDKAEIVAEFGGMVFLDISGKALLNEFFTVDNIASGSW